MKKSLLAELLLLQFCLVLILFCLADVEISITAQPLIIDQKWAYSDVNDFFWSAPTIADLDMDGELDVFLESENGILALDSQGELLWNTTALDNQYSTSTITNIDNDTELEILASDFHQGVFCLTASGEQIWNYSRQFIESNIIAADVNNDDSIEIVVGTYQDILCLNASGDLLWEYPIDIFRDTIAVADLDNDLELEILVSSTAEELICLRGDGSLNWTTSYFGAPSVADLNRDGQVEILLSSHDGIVCLNNTGGFLWEYVGGCNALSVANILDSEELEVIACREGDQSIVCLDWQGNWNWYYFMTETPTSICIADLDGNDELDIIIGTDDSYIVCISPSKEVEWELFLSPASAEVGYPCIMDLDNNERLEIVFTHVKTIYCYEVTSSASGDAPWYCLGGTVFRTGAPDSDNDYLDDVTELNWWQTNPAKSDTDSDGLRDGEEVLQYHTNPLNADTDGDGFLDGEEVANGTDPLIPNRDYRLIIRIVISLSVSILVLVVISIATVYYFKHSFFPKKKLLQLVETSIESGKERIAIEELLQQTSLQKEKAVKILQESISKKEQHVTILSDYLYFLDNFDIEEKLVNFDEEIKKLIDSDIEEGEIYQRISQIATELQTLEFLAKGLSNRNALGKCEMLFLTISSYMKEMKF
ncbi:MAG: hypothetical protein ACTSUP_09815 [Candidatus Heimdallarchaeaceae archaeon]